MHAHELRGISLFKGLSDQQLSELVEAGTEITIEPGVILWNEGEPADFWWVLVDGALELLRHLGREDTVVGKMDVPGRWAGGFRAWDESSVYLATGRGSEAGRVLRVPATALRRLFGEWFPFGVHFIEGLYGTVRRVESTIRQREALATLGTLSAGLAHEINNPAAAASRAAEAMEDASRMMLASMGSLTRTGITPAQFAGLESLHAEITTTAPAPDALTLADQEDLLIDWLSERSVEHDWVIGPTLAAAGVDLEWCERAESLFGGPALEPALEWVAATLSMEKLLSEVRESTRRVSELVLAVKSYSQMDRGSRQNIDVVEGLESTLVMLGHKLRDGVEVVREYSDNLPSIDAYPGELNQVWTNLIDNAVDAMEGRGILRVATLWNGSGVTVEIGDTGPGLAPPVAKRAFEAFYTTKDVGKGTGLGLDIARRIVVERHGGTIDIESEPGRTVFRVRLPLLQV
ncbi:sensor histidine kinase [Arthrobacter sp. D3-16]